jgi:alginate biosynthesis protein AlgX
MTPTFSKSLIWSLLGLAFTAGNLQADPLPVYKAEPCCQLCPKASSANLYNTKFLSFFSTLVEAPDNWLFRTKNDLRTQFGVSADGYRQLKTLRDQLKQRGTELVIVYQPTRGLVHPDKLGPAAEARFNYAQAAKSYASTLDQLRKQGIWVPDLTSVLNEKFSDDRSAYFFKGDHHWTPNGADRTARLVAETVKKIPAFSEIPRQEFVTRRSGLLGKRGTLYKAAGQLCGTSYAEQFVDRFTTEPLNEEASNDDLFGEKSAPQIVLIGTSNSGDNYNFAGFLQQHLGAEVFNASLVGGGFDGALTQYLASDEFQSKPPKVIIWEFGSYYDLSQPTFYREILPMVNNGCANSTPLLQQKNVALKPGMNQVLINSQNLDLTSRDHLLEVRYADPSISTLRATVWYMTGKKDQIKMERSSEVDTNGRFVTALRRDAGYGDLTILGMDVELPEGAPSGSKISAMICSAAPKSGRLQAQRP